MAWGKSNEQWNHTASIMHLLASIHSDPNGTRPSISSFHPYMEQPEPPTATPEILKSLGFKLKQETTNGGR